MASGLIVVHEALRDAFRQSGITIPDDVEGACMIGTARLFQSGLADKAWAGLQWGGAIQHVCAVTSIAGDVSASFDTVLAAIALAPPDAGNPRAMILKSWRA